MRCSFLRVCGVGLAMAAMAAPCRADEVLVITPTGSAIQAALDAAALDPAVDTVRLADGVTYEVSQPLRVFSGLTLAGPEAPTGAKPTLMDTSTVGGGAILDLTDQSNVTVTGLTIDGSGGQADVGVLAWGETVGSTNIAVTGLDVRDIGNTLPGADPNQFGVFFAGDVTDSRIAANTIDGVLPSSAWSAGVRVANGSSRNVIEYNTIRRTGRGGILANDGSADLYIRRNDVSESALGDDGFSAGFGIELFNGSDRSVVEHNTVDRWISVDHSDFVALRQNDVTLPPGEGSFAGIELVDNSFVVVADNRVDGAVNFGVSLTADEPVSRGLFLLNEIRGANRFGVQLFGDAADARGLFFRENTIADSAPPPGSTNPVRGSGVHLLGDVDEVVFEANTITGNAADAVLLSAPPSDFLVFLDNAIAGNGDDTLPAGVATEQPPGDVFVDPNAGENLTLAFAGIGAPVLVLWDLGRGAPITSTSATLPVPYTETGTYLAAVAWDALGRSAYAEVRQVPLPEPATALGVTLAVSTGIRRRR